MHRPSARHAATQNTKRVYTGPLVGRLDINHRGEVVVTGPFRIPQPASFTRTNPPSKGR